MTKSPLSLNEITEGGGWQPSGRGVFVEKIVLSEDGSSFDSKMSYKPFHKSGNPPEGSGEAEVEARRMKF